MVWSHYNTVLLITQSASMDPKESVTMRSTCTSSIHATRLSRISFGIKVLPVNRFSKFLQHFLKTRNSNGGKGHKILEELHKSQGPVVQN